MKDVEPGGQYSAFVKRDGCVNLNTCYNGTLDEPESERFPSYEEVCFHFCDLDEMIERLTKLKAACLAHFGSDWPES